MVADKREIDESRHPWLMLSRDEITLETELKALGGLRCMRSE